MLYHNTICNKITLQKERPMSPRFLMSVSAIALLLMSAPARAEFNVITSIKPVQSLVAAVMQGVGTPGLIVEATGSPHNYSLKPSKAAELQSASVVFWIGHELESFLEKPIESLGSNAKAVSLLDIEGLIKLPPREGNGFDPHMQEGEEVHEEGHEEVDAHIWLDPENAKRIVNVIAKTLSEADGAHAATYTANAASTNAKIDALETELESQLTPLHGKGFIVFHDAYQYFEKRFGLQAAGAITINPENPPGAAGIIELKKRIADGKATCVFAEPQFDNKLVGIITEGTAVKSAVLDPLGAALQPGPELYGNLMRDLAKSLVSCLT